MDMTLYVAVRHKEYGKVQSLVEKGASVNACNENGDSPLHVAAKCGHSYIVALLVALGAQLDARNKDGYTPLHCAVMDKNPFMVEMLLRFGFDPCVTEWDWSDTNFGSKEKQILDAFDRQCQFIPGFRHGLISKDVFYIKPNEPCQCKHLQLEIETTPVTKPFILQCYKMQLEYSNVKHNLHKEQDYLTDLYELRTWNCQEETLHIHVTIDGQMKPNRKLKLFCFDNCIGRVDEEFYTSLDTTEIEIAFIVDVYINIKNDSYQTFIIGSEEKSEQFQILTSAVTLIPKSIPGAEINIQDDAFRTDSCITLNVINTTEMNREEGKAVVLTDMLIINSSDDIKPEKEIGITMPVHTITGDQNIIIMSSTQGQSEADDDWKTLESTNISDNGALSFKTRQFHIFVAVSRHLTLTDSSLTEIKSTLDRILLHQKLVYFLIFTKKVQETEGDLTVVVQCVLCRKKRMTQELWDKKGYKLVNSSEPVSCTVNSTFQIVLCGNIEDIFHTKKMELEFHLFRNNCRVFNICVIDKEYKAEGKIKIQQVLTYRQTVEIVGNQDTGCFACGTNRPQTTGMNQVITIYSCNLSFDHKDHSRTLRKIFNGFKLTRTLQRHKITPVG